MPGTRLIMALADEDRLRLDTAREDTQDGLAILTHFLTVGRVKPCSGWLRPTLAYGTVDFGAEANRPLEIGLISPVRSIF